MGNIRSLFIRRAVSSVSERSQHNKWYVLTPNQVYMHTSDTSWAVLFKDDMVYDYDFRTFFNNFYYASSYRL